jgi:DNA-binding XRE family transcriptional regulator
MRVSTHCSLFMNTAAEHCEARTLADHIRQKRASLGMSQQGLAVELGVDPFTLSAWERGKAKPRWWNRKRIFDWLGFDPACPETCKI